MKKISSRRSRPRVLFYSDVFEPMFGGLVTSLRRILVGLARSDAFDVHLLTYDPKLARRGPRIAPEGYTVHGHGVGEGNIAYLYVQSATRSLIRLHREYDFDIFVAFFAHMPLMAVATAAAALDVPYIICARGSDINVNMKQLVHRRSLRDYFRGAQAIACVSEQMIRRAVRLKLAPHRDIISMVSNAIDPAPFRGCYERKERRRSEYDFIFVGGARPVKRFDLVIDAMERFARMGVAPRLGALLLPHRRHPELIEEYRQEVTVRGVEDLVTFLTPVRHDRMPSLYARSKCVLVTSDSEGCSNIMLEGMAAGCYVIVRNSCMPKGMRGRGSWTFSDLDGLCDAMDSALAAPDCVVHDNVRCIEKNSSLSAEVEAYRHLIDAAIAEHGKCRRGIRGRKKG